MNDPVVDHAKQDSEDGDARSCLLARWGDGGLENGGDGNQKDAYMDAGKTKVQTWNNHSVGSIWEISVDGRDGHKVSQDAQKATLEAEEENAVRGSRTALAVVDGGLDCRDTRNDCCAEQDESWGKSRWDWSVHAVHQLPGSALVCVRNYPYSLVAE